MAEKKRHNTALCPLFTSGNGSLHGKPLCLKHDILMCWREILRGYKSCELKLGVFAQESWSESSYLIYRRVKKTCAQQHCHMRQRWKCRKRDVKLAEWWGEICALFAAIDAASSCFYRLIRRLQMKIISEMYRKTYRKPREIMWKSLKIRFERGFSRCVFRVPHAALRW